MPQFLLQATVLLLVLFTAHVYCQNNLDTGIYLEASYGPYSSSMIIDMNLHLFVVCTILNMMLYFKMQ